MSINVSILKPAYGNKSFYGKAKVIEADGVKYLKSYDTIVCAITPDGNFEKLWDGWSATTTKHVNSFRSIYGLDYIGKAAWQALQVAKDFVIPRSVYNVEMKYKATYYAGYNSLY